MKRNKSGPPLCIVLIFVCAAFQPVAAAGHTAQASEYRDSTFTIPIKQGDRITVQTSNINLTIRRWAESRARLVVTAAPEDWQTDLLVRMEANSDGILVSLSPKPTKHGESYQLPPGWSSIKATLDIPDDHEFVLASLFANVDIQSDFKSGNFTVNNGELTASSIPRLELKSLFAKVHLKDCQVGKITVNNGEFTASDIPQLDLHALFAKVHINSCHQATVEANNTTMTIGAVDKLQLTSMFATIDLKTVNQLTLTSNNDAISIDDLGTAMGRKTFGSLKIGKLRKGFSLVGQNADVSFEEISATVETIKIEDQFGKLNIPVEGLPGFSLRFDGMFATVRSSLPRKPVGDQNQFNHTEFTIDKGAGGGKFPSINLRCNNCQVDLE